MFGVLKTGGTDLILKVKGIFTSSESQVYVKDLRKVMVYKDGRKCQYPKNYDEIVKSGEIIEKKDSNGKLVKDEKGNPEYQLVYDGSKFNLALVSEVDNRSYFTINFLVDLDKREFRSGDRNDYSKFYQPFKFSKIDLKKHIPIFEAQKKDGKFELTNSSFLAKKGYSINDKTGKVNEEYRDKEGRNGKLLYTSDYKKLSTSFSEIRDQNNNLELDKSMISVPIVFVTSLAKVCTRLLTFIPMKLGENLIGRQNPIAKFLGYVLFIPAIAVKNLVNVGATMLKVPILLFVANEKKYGDAYYTMWKYQLKGCWKEAKSDFSVIENGKRLKPEKKNHPNRDPICGTWKELNARKPDVEKSLERGLSESREPVVGESLKEKLQNKTDEKIAAAVNQKSNTPHIDRERERRQDSSQNLGTPSRP